MPLSGEISKRGTFTRIISLDPQMSVSLARLRHGRTKTLHTLSKAFTNLGGHTEMDAWRSSTVPLCRGARIGFDLPRRYLIDTLLDQCATLIQEC